MSNPLLTRFAGTAAGIAPETLNRVEACLEAVMVLEHGPLMLREATAAAEDGFWPEPGSWKAAYRPYVVADGILQIPVKGVLLHDFSFAVGSFATGYTYIRRAFERGMADPNVKGIALLCDSPGGEVAGCFDLVDAMHAGKGAKPIWAFAHEVAYSAAYAVASVADKIWVSRTGGVGSIGVVTFHVDRSGALERAGLKITFIYAGKHKVDGNSAGPLSEDVRARMQTHIDALMSIFVTTVARNRRMPEAAIRATEALTYLGSQGVAVGLADAVGSVDDAVTAFAAELGTPARQDEQMTASRPEVASMVDRMRARHGLSPLSADPGGPASGTAGARAEGGSAGDAAHLGGSRGHAAHEAADDPPDPIATALAAGDAPSLSDRMRERSSRGGTAGRQISGATLEDRMRERFGLSAEEPVAEAASDATLLPTASP